jgi:hypothetical protein
MLKKEILLKCPPGHKAVRAGLITKDKLTTTAWPPSLLSVSKDGEGMRVRSKPN